MKIRFSIFVLSIFSMLNLVLPAGSASANSQNDHIFNNACDIPDSTKIRVPRTVEELQLQLGSEFKVIKKDNFIIATDLNQQKINYVVDGVFASCKNILLNQFFDKKATDVVTIYLFKDKFSYAAGLKKCFKMTPISPYGHYGHSQRYIVVNYSTGPGTLVHELTHALMAVDFPEAPIWICEGLASLFEQCKVESGALKGEQNWRLPELHRGISANRLTPLKLLFKSDTKIFRMLRESLHYAESRYFCKYLEERGLLERVYKAFRDNVEKDRTGVSVVEMAFGKDIDAIERDWIEWVKVQTWHGNEYKTKN